MKKLLLSLFVVLSAIVGVHAQSSYTIEFASTAKGSTPISTSTQATTFVASASTKWLEASPVKKASSVYYGGSTDIDKSAIRLGAKNSAGSITLKLSEAGKVKATKITISAQKYENYTNTNVSICGKTCNVTTTTLTDYSVDLDGKNLLSELEIATSGTNKNRIYIRSISVTYNDNESGDVTLGELSATYDSEEIANNENLTVEYGSSISFSADYATSFAITEGETTTTINATNGKATWTPAVCKDVAVSVVAKREIKGEDEQTSEPLTFNLTVVKPDYLIANWIITNAGNADSAGTVDLDLTLDKTSSPGKWHAYGTKTYSSTIGGGAQLGSKSSPFTNGTITLTDSEIPADAIIREITFNGYTNDAYTLAVTVNGVSAGNISVAKDTATDHKLSGLELEGNEIVFTATSATKYLCVKGFTIKYAEKEKQPGDITMTYDENFSECLDYEQGKYWHMVGNKMTFTSADAAKMTITCDDAAISLPEAVDGSSITWVIPEGLDNTAVTVTGSSKSGSLTSSKTYTFTSELITPLKPLYNFDSYKSVNIFNGGQGILMFRTFPYDPYAEEDIATLSIETNREWYFTPGKTMYGFRFDDISVIMTIQAKSVTPLAESDVLTLYVDGNGQVSGIENIATDATANEAIYFNLQGQRVNADQPGLYIRQQNGKAEKIIVR